MGYTIEAVEKRRRIIRIILFVIILGTMPFYCVGFLLWGTAKPRGAAFATPVVTNTPIGNGVPSNTPFPTLTALFGTPTGISPLLPTPLQFIPPGGGSGGGGQGGGGNVVPTATIYVPPVIPTAAPTLTPFPTNTPLPTLAPPTDTPLPIPTDTPIPPTDTPAPPPTDTPAPPPTDTPIPFDIPTDTPASP